jgi:polyhydroxyalkanoate synthesis repressor PhaR
MQQFRKYPNRRIYDLGTSKYVTLDYLLELIVAGVSIRVEEAESGEDITQTTLLQILAKEELKQTSPLLTNLALEQLIRLTCNP